MQRGSIFHFTRQFFPKFSTIVAETFFEILTIRTRHKIVIIDYTSQTVVSNFRTFCKHLSKVLRAQAVMNFIALCLKIIPIKFLTKGVRPYIIGRSGDNPGRPVLQFL